MQNMQNTVNQVVKKIKQGVVFDSHFVISEIITQKHYHDTYIHSACPNGAMKTGQLHGQIAQCIGRSPSAEKMKDKSWSHDIFGDAKGCQLWRRKRALNDTNGTRA